jgi:acetyl-CoA C-acetyltransferase
MDHLGDLTRIPVIVGCGQVNDRAGIGAEGLDSLGLMIAAARAADQDAGDGLLAQTDWLGVVHQLSFPQLTGKLVSGLSDALGITPANARETASPTGDSPILLINEAANAIGSGSAKVALIIGGEALRTAAGRRAEAAPLASANAQEPYPRRLPIHSDIRMRYGLITPTDIYPLYENAARPAYGQTLAEGQVETGLIWANMSRVAARNPAAWIQKPRSAAEIVEPSEDNRPIAFPYNKFMVANASVNQGAGVIVTSLSIALKAGIPDDQIIFIGPGGAAHEDENPLHRADFASSPSAQVSIRRTLSLNGLLAKDIDHFELYSCFPSVPKMARRILGLPANAAMTVVGGLTFGGGPIGNYMTHAAACMVDTLRLSGTHGLLFANGGYGTHNHTILFTRQPQKAGTFPQDFDYQSEAEDLRGSVPVMLEVYSGPAKIETYTVFYDRMGAVRHGIVIARTPSGQRTVAKVMSEDMECISALTSGSAEPVGRTGSVRRDGDINIWHST